jgi:hypothetical protein
MYRRRHPSKGKHMSKRDKKRDAEIAEQCYVNPSEFDYKKYADLIRADEREACANIARDIGNATESYDWALDKCYEIETAIRARGKT